MSETPHRIVAGLLRKDRRVLLCHRRPDRLWYPDVWDLPGGHVDLGERDRDALCRELREALGIAAQLASGVAGTILTDSEAGFELAIWIIDSWHGDVINAAPEEHDQIGWFGGDDFAQLQLAHPMYLALLQDAVAERRG